MSGYIDRQGQVVVAPTLRTADRFTSGLARAVPYGSWDFGFIDTHGAWVAAPELQFFGDWSDGVATFNRGGRREEGRIVGGRWGWVGDGRMLCSERFEDAGSFKHELIAVMEGGRWGYADKSGALRIAPRFEWASDFSSDGVATAVEGGKDGYIRPDGSWLLAPQYERADPFAQGRGRVREGDQFHYVDMHGNRVSEGYDEAMPHCDGMAKVRRGESVGLIDLQGRLIADAWFDEVGWWTHGLAPVRRGDEWFLLDVAGNLHGPYSNALPASEGLARFVQEGVGFLAPDGRVVIAPIYDSARGFAGDHAAVKREGRWTFVDRNGRELHEPRWDRVGEFAEGLAQVREGGKWGVIDESGRVVVEPRFASLDRFSGGLAAVRMLDMPSVITSPAANVTVVPEGGLRHPGFADANASDELRLTLCFSSTPETDPCLRMQQIVGNWQSLLEANHDGPVLVGGRPWIADYALSVRVKNVDAPVAALQLLLDELAPIGLPVQEMVLGRFRSDPSQPLPQLLYPVVPAVPDPRDPQGETFFSTFEDYADAAFDFDGVAPRSESFQHLLAGRWVRLYEQMAFDERTFTLYRDDVRICYGCRQDDPWPEDARTVQVHEVVDRHLARVFDRARLWVFPGNAQWRTPTAMLRDGSGGVERIDLDGRRGYSFGIDAVDLLQDIGPDIFRYREPELMDALAGAVHDLQLEKVIMWQRFGNALEGPSYPGIAHPMQPTVYVVNLWERT